MVNRRDNSARFAGGGSGPEEFIESPLSLMATTRSQPQTETPPGGLGGELGGVPVTSEAAAERDDEGRMAAMPRDQMRPRVRDQV